MFSKNSLTKNVKKTILNSDAKCSELGGFTRLCVHKVAMLCAINPRASHKGGFLRFQKSNQNNYKLTKLSATNSRQQKTSSSKLVKKMQIETIKQIISEILETVKRKISILKFAENKLKSPRF